LTGAQHAADGLKTCGCHAEVCPANLGPSRLQQMAQENEPMRLSKRTCCSRVTTTMLWTVRVPSWKTPITALCPYLYSWFKPHRSCGMCVRDIWMFPGVLPVHLPQISSIHVSFPSGHCSCTPARTSVIAMVLWWRCLTSSKRPGYDYP
jgi:hypothetical protein